ncbi:MAG TPA: Hsp20/alpha crystallin family protein [Chitinophagaceae bacterium]
MATKSLMRPETAIPALFDDFFKPWNEMFDNSRFWGRAATVPPVNIIETPNEYKVSLAAPGIKKEDFKIDVNGNMLTISAEKEEKVEEKEDKYTRREFNYTTFTRSFAMPDDVQFDKVDARYVEGVLELMLPKKEEAKKATITKNIPIK